MRKINLVIGAVALAVSGASFAAPLVGFSAPTSTATTPVSIAKDIPTACFVTIDPASVAAVTEDTLVFGFDLYSGTTVPMYKVDYYSNALANHSVTLSDATFGEKSLAYRSDNTEGKLTGDIHDENATFAWRYTDSNAVVPDATKILEGTTGQKVTMSTAPVSDVASYYMLPNINQDTSFFPAGATTFSTTLDVSCDPVAAAE